MFFFIFFLFCLNILKPSSYKCKRNINQNPFPLLTWSKYLCFFFFFKLMSLVVVCSISIVINTIYFCWGIKMFYPLVPLGWKIYQFHWGHGNLCEHRMSCVCWKMVTEEKRRGKEKESPLAGQGELIFFHCIFPWSSSLTLICPV